MCTYKRGNIEYNRLNLYNRKNKNNFIWLILFWLDLFQIEKTGINQNDYGLNDVSARDSSDDESGPKKPVPIWAKSKCYR